MSQPEVELEGCGSHSCVIKKPVGQGTNSGCLCNASTLRLHIQKLNRRPAPIDGGGLDEKAVAKIVANSQLANYAKNAEWNQDLIDEIISTFGNRGLVAIDVNKINHAIWQVDEAMPLDLRMKIAEHICSKLGTPPTKGVKDCRHVWVPCHQSIGEAVCACCACIKNPTITQSLGGKG